MNKMNLNVGDTRLNIETHGEGKPIIFVHGGPGGNYLSFRKFIGTLNGYKLVFYDQRGSGDSDRLPSPEAATFSLDKHINDIEEIRTNLGVDKVILLGHSWGGSLVSFYTHRYPERVEKLIIYSGGPETREMADEKNANMLNRLAESERKKGKSILKDLGTLLEEKSDQNLIDNKISNYLEIIAPALEKNVANSKRSMEGRFGFWAAQYTNLYMKNFDRDKFLSELKSFTAPVLISYGEYEPSPKNRFLDLHKTFPNSNIIKFENSGHQALYEEHDLFIKSINDFLSK